MTISKRTKLSLFILIGLLAASSLTLPFLFIFITVPLLLLAVGFFTAKKVRSQLPEGLLFLLISVLIGGASVFLSAVILYTAIEMGYNGKSNEELDRMDVLQSAGETARNVTVFLAFLFSYMNFLAFLDDKREKKAAKKQNEES
ncbi:hypothetical protein MKY84_05765 [Chryseomicrobium sp. FSL W7-1435]|uniref:hypothetical protein n=1 Tax=Chryseomicrobium sp. FSL W7-1435 TaxID=2921704 RepID=UPI00315A11DB